MTICKSAEEACANAEAIVVNTEWDEFKNLDWQKSERKKGSESRALTSVYDNCPRPAFVFE